MSPGPGPKYDFFGRENKKFNRVENTRTKEEGGIIEELIRSMMNSAGIEKHVGWILNQPVIKFLHSSRLKIGIGTVLFRRFSFKAYYYSIILLAFASPTVVLLHD